MNNETNQNINKNIINNDKGKIILEILNINYDIKTLTISELEKLKTKHTIIRKINNIFGIDFNKSILELNIISNNLDKLYKCPICLEKATLQVPIINNKKEYCPASLYNRPCTRCIRAFLISAKKSGKTQISCLNGCCMLNLTQPIIKSYGAIGRDISGPNDILTYSSYDNLGVALGKSLANTICHSCEKDCESIMNLSIHYKRECKNTLMWCNICNKTHSRPLPSQKKCHCICKYCKKELPLNDYIHNCELKPLETILNRYTNSCVCKICKLPIQWNNINIHKNCMNITLFEIIVVDFKGDTRQYVGKKKQKKLRLRERLQNEHDAINNEDRIRADEEIIQLNNSIIPLALDDASRGEFYLHNQITVDHESRGEFYLSEQIALWDARR